MYDDQQAREKKKSTPQKVVCRNHGTMPECSGSRPIAQKRRFQYFFAIAVKPTPTRRNISAFGPVSATRLLTQHASFCVGVLEGVTT